MKEINVIFQTKLILNDIQTKKTVRRGRHNMVRRRPCQTIRLVLKRKDEWFTQRTATDRCAYKRFFVEPRLGWNCILYFVWGCTSTWSLKEMNSQPIRIVLRWNERKGVEKGGKVQGGGHAPWNSLFRTVLSDMLGRPFLHTSLYNILRYDALR